MSKKIIIRQPEAGSGDFIIDRLEGNIMALDEQVFFFNLLELFGVGR